MLEGPHIAAQVKVIDGQIEFSHIVQLSADMHGLCQRNLNEVGNLESSGSSGDGLV